MSAAEKLKRLDEERVKPTAAGYHEVGILYDVLPQIVAVVEAAEAVAGPAVYRIGLTGRAAQSRDALAALDEKL